MHKLLNKTTGYQQLLSLPPDPPPAPAGRRKIPTTTIIFCRLYLGLDRDRTAELRKRKPDNRNQSTDFRGRSPLGCGCPRCTTNLKFCLSSLKIFEKNLLSVQIVSIGKMSDSQRLRHYLINTDLFFPQEPCARKEKVCVHGL